jgi:hypothetical protein
MDYATQVQQQSVADAKAREAAALAARQRTAASTNDLYASQGYAPNSNGGFSPTAGTSRAQGIQDIGNEQEQKLFDAYMGLLGPNGIMSSSSSSGSGSGAGSAPAYVQPSTAGGAGGGRSVSSVAPLTMPDTSHAQQAAYNAAKDQVGQTSQAALRGLRSELGATGMLGSGSQSMASAGIVNGGQQELGKVTRQNAQQTADLAEKQAEANLSAGVAQRGQDVSARGQDISAQVAANSLAQSAANAQNDFGLTAYKTQADINLAEQQMQQQRLMQILSGISGKLNVGLSY